MLWNGFKTGMHEQLGLKSNTTLNEQFMASRQISYRATIS